jgi:hypothetical protein
VQIFHEVLTVAPKQELEIALCNERRPRLIGVQIPTAGKDARRTALPLGHGFVLSPLGVQGRRSCRLRDGIARAPPALGLSPGHHVSARIEAAAAERAGAFSSRRGGGRRAFRDPAGELIITRVDFPLARDPKTANFAGWQVTPLELVVGLPDRLFAVLGYCRGAHEPIIIVVN